VPGTPWPADGREVLLRMHRFAQSALWQHRAQAGTLALADADALAQHVAAFHLGLPPLTQAPARGTLHWVRESLDGVASHPARPAWLALQRVQALRPQLQAALQALAGWHAQRVAQGWLREAHGDLHLANLVDWQGSVVAFDALEFEPDLRCIDVMNDAAFAFMDLQAHGLPALAWRFLDGYLAHTGDYAGLRGLRAWASYRALVRAKVALLSDATAATLARYWTLAERLAAPPPTPRLVLTMGLSGSGKSTAAALAVECLATTGAQHGGPCTGAVRLRSDVERKRLLGLAPTHRPGPSVPATTLYSADTTQRTYQQLQDLSAELLGLGQSVVVDAASLRQAERDTLRHLAQQSGAHFTLLECVAPVDQMQARLAQRLATNTDPSDATPAVLAQQTTWAEPVPAHWAPVHRRIHNTGTLDNLRQQVAAALG
jgi:predicted kinase